MSKEIGLEDEVEQIAQDIWARRDRKDSKWIDLIYNLSSSLIGDQPEKGSRGCKPLQEIYDINLIHRCIDILRPEIEWKFLIDQLEARKKFILEVRAPWENLIKEEFPSANNTGFIINQFSKNIKSKLPKKDLHDELNRILPFISQDDRVGAWDALFKQFFLYLENKGYNLRAITGIIHDIISKERLANQALTMVKGLVVLTGGGKLEYGKVVDISLQMVEDRLYSLDEKNHFEAATISLLDYFRKKGLNIPARGWRYVEYKENEESYNYKGNSDTLAKILGVAAIHLKLNPKDELAVTGDVDKGKIQPIEGIVDKFEAAAADSSIKTILMPHRNKGELKDISDKKIRIIPLESSLEDAMNKYFGKEEVQSAIEAQIEDGKRRSFEPEEVVEGVLKRINILSKKFIRRGTFIVVSILATSLLAGSLFALNTLLHPKICLDTFPDGINVFVDDKFIGLTKDGEPLCTRLSKLGQKRFGLRLEDETKLCNRTQDQL